MRTKVSYLAEKLASGELSACEALNKCVDIDRARDVFELAELLKYLKLLKDWEEWSKLNDECNDWEWFQKDYFQDADWIMDSPQPSEGEIWLDYDLAEQERLAPSDREIQIGKLARELARRKLTYYDSKVWSLIAKFYKEYNLSPKEQILFTDEYISECARIQGV